jgi:hypothetical protein
MRQFVALVSLPAVGGGIFHVVEEVEAHSRDEVCAILWNRYGDGGEDEDFLLGISIFDDELLEYQRQNGGLSLLVGGFLPAYEVWE